MDEYPTDKMVKVTNGKMFVDIIEIASTIIDRTDRWFRIIDKKNTNKYDLRKTYFEILDKVLELSIEEGVIDKVNDLYSKGFNYRFIHVGDVLFCLISRQADYNPMLKIKLSKSGMVYGRSVDDYWEERS